MDMGFSVRQPVWGSKCKVLENNVYDIKQAITEAGLDWSVEKRQLYSIQESVVNGEKVEQRVIAPDCFGVYRTDTNQYLGRVGSRYNLLQNSVAFDFFQPFLHEKDVYLETAGALHGGRVIIVNARVEGTTGEVVDGDKVSQRLLLTNSHDGSVSLSVMFHYTRIWCSNRLSGIRAEAKASGKFLTVRHTASMLERLKEVQSKVDLARANFNQTMSLYRELAARDMTTEQFRSYLEDLFAADLAKEDSEGNRKTLDTFEPTRRIINNFEETPDIQVDGVRGTAWGAYNSVSEYITWQTGARSVDNQLSSMFFGEGRKLLERSFEKLLALA